MFAFAYSQQVLADPNHDLPYLIPDKIDVYYQVGLKLRRQDR